MAHATAVLSLENLLPGWPKTAENEDSLHFEGCLFFKVNGDNVYTL